MTTSVVPQTQVQSDEPGEEHAAFGLVRRLVRVQDPRFIEKEEYRSLLLFALLWLFSPQSG